MKAWRYETAQDLDKPMIERLRRFPREPEMFVYVLRALAALLIRVWLKAYHRLKIVGRQHLSIEGSYVLVCNHSSHLDTLCLLAALPFKKLHRTFPAAAADYFFTSVPRVALSAIVVNALPFDRKIHRRQSLSLCRELLANPVGNILILFPEGTRSTTGELGEFRGGIGLLLAGKSIPAVPCYLAGAYEAWPKGYILPRPRQLRLMIGTPQTYESLEVNKESALHICQDLRNRVAALAAHKSI